MRKRWIAMMMTALMACSSVSAFAASSEGLTSIQLNTNYLSLAVGNVYNFDITQQPLSVKARPFTFTSSNTNIIRMSGNTAYAVGVGRATVTVKTEDGTLVDNCVIDVQTNASNNTPNYNYPGYYPYGGYNPSYPYGSYNPSNPYGGYYGSSGSANSASDLPETQVFPNTYVAPGKAKDATELGIEFRQSARVSAGSSVVPFIFTRSEKSIIVTPQIVDYSKVMSLSFRGDILKRLPKFDYKNVEFRVGDRVHVYLTADMNSPVQNVVSLENVNVSSLMATDWAQYTNQVITGPWRIMSNVDKPFMQFRFYLGDGFDLKKNEIALLKWNAEENTFKKVDQSTWKLKIYRLTDVSGKYIETDATFSPGTYAVVSTKDIVL